jgi:adenylate cyclase
VGVGSVRGEIPVAVFGAPNDLVDHADAAVNAAVLIHRLVAERFDGALRIGIGINTGVVIAGTIGGGGKLEFTLIGDTVNVTARVEQLTKTTCDAILVTH